VSALLKLVPAWAWALLGGLLLTCLVGGAQQIRVVLLKGEVSEAQAAQAKAETSLSDYRLEVSERDRRAIAAAREEERRRQVAVDEVEEDGQRKLAAARGDAADAGIARDRLQLEVNRLRAGRAATCNTIAAQQRQAGDRAFTVLADLFESADRRAGELATALDRSRVAGQQCEAAFDTVRGS
jgi:hypothetical protein